MVASVKMQRNPCGSSRKLRRSVSSGAKDAGKTMCVFVS